jgi:hypothetical protein
MLSSCLDGTLQDAYSGKTEFNNGCFDNVPHAFLNRLLRSGSTSFSLCNRNLVVCPPDLDWITTWLSLGHVQVAVLISFLARSVYGNPNDEVKLSYLVSAILCIEITVGIFSHAHLHRPFLLMQLLVWTVQLGCLQWFTYAEYDEPLRLQQKRQRAARYGGSTPTPWELVSAVSRMPQRHNNSSTRSLTSHPGTPCRRSGLATPTNSSNVKAFRIGGCAVVTIALGVITFGSLIQTMELLMMEGKTSYYVGSSSSIRYVSTCCVESFNQF